MNDGSQTTLYMPCGKLVTPLRGQCVPHFLFRTSAPKTNGTTSSTLVQSAAAKNGDDTSDILGRPNAAEILESHCLWKNDRNDNLTSWTSSLLFAVQLAIYRQFNDRDGPDPSSIEIYILDARRLRPETFVCTAPLLGAFDVSNPKLIPEYRYHEYLSQGTIDMPEGAMTVITYQSLIDNGLHELCPAFAEDDQPKQLMRRVKKLRQSFKIDIPASPTPEELRIAQTIAMEWVSSSEMRAVVMATLLSLKRRFRDDAAIMQAFRRTGWGYRVTDDSLDSYSSTSPEFVPEHRQFVEMMYDIHTDTQRQQQLDEVEALTMDVAPPELLEALRRLNV